MPLYHAHFKLLFIYLFYLLVGSENYFYGAKEMHVNFKTLMLIVVTWICLSHKSRRSEQFQVLAVNLCNL